MSRKRRPAQPATGMRHLLSEDRHAKLVELSKAGIPALLAAPQVGVTTRTFDRWLARGRAEEDRILDETTDDGDEPPVRDSEEPYLLLWRDVDAARATAATRNVLQLQRVATGGYVTKETTRQFRDPASGKLVTETVKDIASPDWKANAWMLERQVRDHFGRATEQVEVSGPGGGPIEYAPRDADALATKLADNLAAIASVQATRRALEASPAVLGGDEAEDVVDAEVIAF